MEHRMELLLTLLLVTMCAAAFLVLAVQLAGLTVREAVRHGSDGTYLVTFAGPVLGLFAGLFLLLMLAEIEDDWMYLLTWLPVPASLAIGYGYFTVRFARSAPQVIRETFAAAAEMQQLGPDLFRLLDGDRDGVISLEDILASRTEAVRQGISAQTIDAMQIGISEFGHGIGSDGFEPVYAISSNDVAELPGKLREKYFFWLRELNL